MRDGDAFPPEELNPMDEEIKKDGESDDPVDHGMILPKIMFFSIDKAFRFFWPFDLE